MGALPLFVVGLNFAFARSHLTLKESHLPLIRHRRRSGSIPPSPRRSAGQSPATLPSESDGVAFLYLLRLG